MVLVMVVYGYMVIKGVNLEVATAINKASARCRGRLQKLI